MTFILMLRSVEFQILNVRAPLVCFALLSAQVSWGHIQLYSIVLALQQLLEGIHAAHLCCDHCQQKC